MTGRRLSTQAVIAVLSAGPVRQVRPAIHHAAIGCGPPGLLRPVVPALRPVQRLGRRTLSGVWVITAHRLHRAAACAAARRQQRCLSLLRGGPAAPTTCGEGSQPQAGCWREICALHSLDSVSNLFWHSSGAKQELTSTQDISYLQHYVAPLKGWQLCLVQASETKVELALEVCPSETFSSKTIITSMPHQALSSKGALHVQNLAAE